MLGGHTKKAPVTSLFLFSKSAITEDILSTGISSSVGESSVTASVSILWPSVSGSPNYILHTPYNRDNLMKNINNKQ